MLDLLHLVLTMNPFNFKVKNISYIILFRMRLENYRSDFSPYFDRGGDRVVIPNNVKLVVGSRTFNCSG